MDSKLPPQITSLLSTAPIGDEGLLLRELQHRHANDVTIIIAAVRVCAKRIGRDSPQSLLLLGLAQKLQAIGEVNVILAGPGQEGVEDLAPVLELLGDAASRRGPAHVRIEVDAQTLHVRNHVSRRLALVVNELLLNAAKHSQVEGTERKVSVLLADDGHGTYLSVESDGVCEAWGREGGQGLLLIDELVSGLGGDVIRSRASGRARTELIFPSLSIPQCEDPF